jgi:hypothetical protein
MWSRIDVVSYLVSCLVPTSLSLFASVFVLYPATAAFASFLPLLAPLPILACPPPSAPRSLPCVAGVRKTVVYLWAVRVMDLLAAHVICESASRSMQGYAPRTPSYAGLLRVDALFRGAVQESLPAVSCASVHCGVFCCDQVGTMVCKW